MSFEFDYALPLAIALAIGLLLGLERERRKGEGAERRAAGVRTFALIAVLGSLCAMLPIAGLALVVGGFVGALAVVSHVRRTSIDPGITTEMAMMTAYVLGLLTQSSLGLAAGLAVVITILLASRDTLHAFVTEVLSNDEFHDVLALAAVALVILPLVPNQGIGPFEAFNPFTAWRLVVIVMLAQSAGYAAQRLWGARVGLPLAGFFGGFVSSAATIAAMRTRASGQKAVQPAVAGAVLSNVATVLQLGLVVAAVSTETFVAIAPSLGVGCLVAVAYAVPMALLVRNQPQAGTLPLGRPFDFRSALQLAALVSIIMFGSALLLNVLGDRGALVAAGLGGFADAHAAAISTSSLVAAGKLGASAAVVPILVGVTTNSLTKIVLAIDRRTPAFSVQVPIGVLLVLAAMWAATLR